MNHLLFDLTYLIYTFEKFNQIILHKSLCDIL